MTTFNKFELDFFELANQIKDSAFNRSDLSKTLLKLNNPTYYVKYSSKFAGERHGFTNGSVKNPILLAVQNMLNLLKQEIDMSSLVKGLQTEFAWAYNNFMHYKSIDL